MDMGAHAAAVLDTGLRGLRDDHESGARQLASKALDVFARVVPLLDASSREVWWTNVRSVGWHLWKNGRESMGAPILNAVLSCLAIIEDMMPAGGARLPARFVDDVVAAVARFAEQRQESSSSIADALCAFISSSTAPQPLRILALSSSSTVASCLTHALAQGYALDLHVLESRPLFEGATMARSIAAFARQRDIRTSVSVHTDASAALAARGAHLVLLGCDLIDRHGRVSNKTGSLPAVLVALSEKEKILPLEPPPGQEHQDPAEVSRAWGWAENAAPTSNINVGNVYFEWVPADLVDHYITEHGVTTLDEIAAWAEAARQRADHFFSGL